MRGPLFSGPVGAAVTLERLVAVIGPTVDYQASPIVVLSTVWLAETLTAVSPVILVVESDNLRTALRALRRVDKAGRSLQVVAAGEDIPLARGRARAIVIDAVADLDEEDAALFVAGLVPFLTVDPGGLLVAMDATRDAAVEARVAGFFLGAGLRGIVQERPRDGAVLTMGRAPPVGVVTALVGGVVADLSG